MKKFSVILVLLALLAIPVMGQVQFGIGPGAQYSYGRQHPIALDYNRTTRCTLFGEMWVNIPIGWILSIRPGLAYSDKEFNTTIVYSGRDHRMVPGTYKAGWIQLPVLLIAQPVKWFHFGGGGYAAWSPYERVRYSPLINVLYETRSHSASKTASIMCCPPPPPPPPKPKPIPNGDPVINSMRLDYGYVVKAGIDWYIKCPTWTCKNSIEFTWTRGIQKVFKTYGRSYVNETMAASFILWF